MTALPPHERIRMGLRRTYQSSLLFRDLTVRDNLFLAVRGVARGRFGFLRPPRRAPLAPRRPTTCSSACASSAVADQPVSALSHGQQRQLEIGMALAGAPRLILFDEPAAGLSPAERRELVRAAHRAARPHGLHHHRARPRRRAARGRAGHRDAQRPRAEARHARPRSRATPRCRRSTSAEAATDALVLPRAAGARLGARSWRSRSSTSTTAARTRSRRSRSASTAA